MPGVGPEAVLVEVDEAGDRVGSRCSPGRSRRRSISAAPGKTVLTSVSSVRRPASDARSWRRSSQLPSSAQAPSSMQSGRSRPGRRRRCRSRCRSRCSPGRCRRQATSAHPGRSCVGVVAVCPCSVDSELAVSQLAVSRPGPSCRVCPVAVLVAIDETKQVIGVEAVAVLVDAVVRTSAAPG